METPKNYGKKWSRHDLNSMKSSFDKGVSIKNLATKYGRTEASVRAYLDRLEIMEEVKKRNITELLHFTDRRNIGTIKKYGLLGINNLKNKNIKFFPNDVKRLDSTENSGFICLSISYLNHYLLKDFNERSKKEWVKISINPNILFTRSGYFYDCNASKTKFRDSEKYSPEYLRSAKAFKSLFANSVNGYQRENINSRGQRSRKLPNAPTDIQAEVQIPYKIPRSYIIAYEEINNV